MGQIGRCENVREMRSVVARFLSPETALTAYRDRRSRESVGHFSTAVKTFAWTRRSPDRRVAAVLLCNTSPRYPVMSGVLCGTHVQRSSTAIPGSHSRARAPGRLRPWLGRQQAVQDLTKDELKARASEFLQRNIADLADAQERLYASDTHSVLIVLQASDAAGKDGTIKHVMSGVNPQGCQIFAFKKPSSEELDHNFLWRYMKALPERGRIGIFNRSYYEDVLVVRVHPEFLGKLPGTDRGRTSGRIATTTSTRSSGTSRAMARWC
jgi:Polyphosphate kinase 2 (PPK2)